MDRATVLRAFDEQVRRHADPDSPDEVVELDAHALRRMPRAGGWTGITWSRLEQDNADALIGEQIERFSALARDWEWKHYSYDEPADLPLRLLARGFSADPAEALLFAEIDALELDPAPPAGIEIVRAREERDVAALAQVHHAVFGAEEPELAGTLAAALGREPPMTSAYLALAAGRPVSAARIELYPDSEFASLWGGATLPEWRKRGIYRALVAARAAFARGRGARYLQVDALPTSQPTLERLGFVRLATTTPYRYRAVT